MFERANIPIILNLPYATRYHKPYKNRFILKQQFTHIRMSFQPTFKEAVQPLIKPCCYSLTCRPFSQ